MERSQESTKWSKVEVTRSLHPLDPLCERGSRIYATDKSAYSSSVPPPLPPSAAPPSQTTSPSNLSCRRHHGQRSQPRSQARRLGYGHPQAKEVVSRSPRAPSRVATSEVRAPRSRADDTVVRLASPSRSVPRRCLLLLPVTLPMGLRCPCADPTASSSMRARRTTTRSPNSTRPPWRRSSSSAETPSSSAARSARTPVSHSLMRACVRNHMETSPMC